MSPSYDLVVHGGQLVLRDSVIQADIAVQNGVIAAIGQNLASQGATLVNAQGLYVMPGVIDVHVHLDEPGLADWEGFETGTQALAAGGCTTFFDMPLNGIPPTISTDALAQKARLAEQRSYIDYELWGGLVPGNHDQLRPLADGGVIAYKAFMISPSPTGDGGFEAVDDGTLLVGMEEIGRLGMILAVHAEGEGIISFLQAKKQQLGHCTAVDYMESRPIIAELEAVNKALLFAEHTGAALHFVHISSKAAVDLIRAAKIRGLDVSVETCAHYLALTVDDATRLGPVAKCAPPLRTSVEQAQLWEALIAGDIDLVSSDHSPCPTALKDGDGSEFFTAWGGIAGGQSTLEVMIDEAVLHHNVPLPRVSQWLSTRPAQRFGLHPHKGEIALGADADLALVQIGPERILTASDLYQRHPHSPYLGRRFHSRVMQTLVRGRVVFSVTDGGFPQPPQGRWVQARLHRPAFNFAGNS